MNLTGEEIRIKVAESLGWTQVTTYEAQINYGNMIGSHIASDGVLASDWVPNYPLDLNACAEFEDHAYRYEAAGWLERYQDELAEQCQHLPYPHWNPVCAPARQRCLAYLKTKGIIA